MSSKFAATVHYDDGTTADVVIGQRELAAFEAQPFATGVRQPLLQIRFGAFEALRRAGRLPRDRKGQPLIFDAWDDLVDEVAAEDDDEEPDPTQPAAPEAG
jgi:hypothetical protein